MTSPTFEPELDQPIPRLVAARGGCGYGCGLWFVRLFILPHTLVGPWILFTAISRIVLSLGVLLAGTNVDGRIVRKIERPGKKDRVYYTAEYVYTVDRVEYPGSVSVNADEYGAMRVGQAITVKVYAPGREGGHWPGVASYSPLAEVGGITLAAIFWNGILSVFLYMLYVRPWRLRQLVRWGLPTEGIVREVNWITNKGNKTAYIRYEYAVPPETHSSGGVFTGKASAPAKAGEGIGVGSVVTVLYDSRRPKRSLMYRLADFQAVLGPAKVPDHPDDTASQ